MRRPQGFYDHERGQPFHPEAYIFNAPQQGSGTSVNKLTMPIVMAVSVGAALMGLSVAATRQLGGLEYAILDLGRKFDTVSAGLSDRIDRIESNTQDRWTRRDHEYWCTRTEQVNSQNGWRCAESPGEAKRAIAPRLQGWQAQAGGMSGQGRK